MRKKTGTRKKKKRMMLPKKTKTLKLNPTKKKAPKPNTAVTKESSAVMIT